MRYSVLKIILASVILHVSGGLGFALTADEINEASFSSGKPTTSKGPDAFVVKAQALLSRKSVSPGVIDGLDGENFRKAINQFRKQTGLPAGEEIDRQTWEALTDKAALDIIIEYKISEQDASYDFADAIPKDYAQQAEMKRLGFTSAEEMFSERFQMGENLFKALNPGSGLNKPGQTIFVVKVDRAKQKQPVTRIEADKKSGMVMVFGAGDKLLASYPATIGSSQTPSPDGEHKITRIAKNPAYHYDPEKNFQQGKNTEKLVLPAGPNNPVGSVWIALSKPTFGIHGTPEPSQVSKSSSHGCIRLTNWDAEELADMVKPGVTVRFVD